MTPEEKKAREFARKCRSILEEAGMHYMVMLFPEDGVVTSAKATQEELLMAVDKQLRECAKALGTTRELLIEALASVPEPKVKKHMTFKRVEEEE